MSCVSSGRAVRVTSFKDILFTYENKDLTILLPSGRKLIYVEAQIYEKTTETRNGQWIRPALRYKGINQDNKQWGWIDTYGGKITENIVQAIARDILAESMLRLDEAGYDIVMHVHDEVACEIPLDDAANELSIIEAIMSEPLSWAPGLPLAADGYITPFYKKD